MGHGDKIFPFAASHSPRLLCLPFLTVASGKFRQETGNLLPAAKNVFFARELVIQALMTCKAVGILAGSILPAPLEQG